MNAYFWVAESDRGGKRSGVVAAYDAYDAIRSVTEELYSGVSTWVIVKLERVE